MRVFLLMIILVGILVVSMKLIEITSHYAYLESVYLSGLNACEHAIVDIKKRCEK